MYPPEMAVRMCMHPALARPQNDDSPQLRDCQFMQQTQLNLIVGRSASV